MMITLAAAHDLADGYGYPRPQLRRAEWWSLNGAWDFAIDTDAVWTIPAHVHWQARIQVPFAPETPASGIGNSGFYRAVWYRRTFTVPPLGPGQRLIVHFGAVDYEAMVWINDAPVTHHVGGFTPFQCDVTDYLRGDGEQTIAVRALDDPWDLAKPRGKQDWHLEPHSIWYPRTTGIWQTVWMERVNSTSIGKIRWTPSLERWEIDLQVRIDGMRDQRHHLHVMLSVGDYILADDQYLVVGGEVHRRIALSDPGIDDYRNELLWNPATPTLISATLELRDYTGRTVDVVHSYTALRSIGIQGDRFVLNGRPYYLRMALDQGYFPHTGLSTPDDAAIRRDVELAKAMGFNGVRRHQTISDPRYLYWADVLGLLVWEEMPSAYRFTRRSVRRLAREWNEVIDRDYSHPCIICWVPFNESWGVPDLPDSPTQRHYVQALYHLTRTLDPTRPVIGNDGWESVATDIIGIHDYDDQPERIAHRYSSDDLTQRFFRRERPGGRMLLVNQEVHTGQPIMLTEFGGIAYSSDYQRTWGYSRAQSAEEFGQRYQVLMDVVRSLSIFSGFCYTQFADTYQETNGLLFADRTPKIPIEALALATAGPNILRDQQIELEWRERMMTAQWQQYAVPSEDYRTGALRSS
jgi:beta-galactosidase/beta-glucuronidase